MNDEIVEVLKEQLEWMLKQDDLFDLGAKALKKTYDSLVRVGFTEDQATRIVAGQGTTLKGGD